MVSLSSTRKSSSGIRRVANSQDGCKGGKDSPTFPAVHPDPSRPKVCRWTQTRVCHRLADKLLSVNPPSVAEIRNRHVVSVPMNGRNAGRAPVVLTLSGNRGVAKIRPRRRWQRAGGLTAATDAFAGPFCNDSAGPSRNVYRREAGSAAHPRRELRAPWRRGRRGESE